MYLRALHFYVEPECSVEDACGYYFYVITLTENNHYFCPKNKNSFFNAVPEKEEKKNTIDQRLQPLATPSTKKTA